MRTRLRDLADLTTVIQGLVLLSGAGILAFIVQSLAEIFLGFSVAERTVLGICAFLLSLAVILAGFKVVWERRTAAEQERDELQEKLQQAEQEREDLRKENEEMISERSIASRQASPPDGLAFYPPIEDHELGETTFTRRTVYLADFARKAAGIRWKEHVLHNITFIECRIVGPAVLALMTNEQGEEGDSLIECAFDEGMDATWRPAWEQDPYTGIIGAEGCLFRGCRFTRVGILQRAEPPAIEGGDETAFTKM